MSKLLRSLGFSFITSATVLLAAPPDAGQLLREQQSPTERQPAQQFPERDVRVETAPVAPAPSVTVLAKSFRFSGYEGLVTEPELQAVVQPSVGKHLGVADLQKLTEQISALLKIKGFFLARAYLPKQDVTDGVIQIAIIQARADGQIGINRVAGVRIRDQRLKKIADTVIKPGQPLRERDLERVLLLMNDIPGVSARAVLSPGAASGTTQVTINVTEKPLFSGALWTDNYGNRYTGTWRGNGLVSVNDPFRIGDQFNVMFSGAEGLSQARVVYGAPLGSRGLRGNISYTGMEYELIDDFAFAKAKGNAHTYNAGVSYPLVRRRALSIHANAGYEFKSLVDKAYGFTIRDKRLHSGLVGFNGDLTDSFGRGGYTNWSVSLGVGDLDLSKNRADQLADKAGARAAGMYMRLNLSASRLQRLTERLTLATSYYGQLASDNLDSSEKFNLGGPFGVRAYPVGEASGDEGHLFNFELREDLPLESRLGNVQVIGFFDTGYVTLNKDPWPGSVSTATEENGYWLSGAGVGVGLSKPGVYSLRLNYAHKIGENPGRSASGRDADGRDSEGRIWAMGQLAF